MKIWYQSMSRFQTKWKSYPKYLRQILDQVKDPDTEIELHGITKIGGFADQYRYLEYLETGEVMENVHTAMERGFDAFQSAISRTRACASAGRSRTSPCSAFARPACMWPASWARVSRS
jgi:hypothetical protein